MEERAQEPSGSGGARRQQPSEGAGVPPAPVVGPTIATPRPWIRGGGGGRGGSSTRWASVGCGAVVVALIALLLVGVSLTKRTAWIAFARGRQRLVEVVGREHPTQRLRTTRNLDRFAARLRASRDPYRALGEFLAQERDALADGRLDAAELDSLNRFLENAASSPASAPDR